MFWFRIHTLLLSLSTKRLGNGHGGKGWGSHGVELTWRSDITGGGGNAER